MKARIKAIEYYLPEKILSNKQLAMDFADWTEEKILEKTGIAERRIAGQNECASDLAFYAAQKLFDSQVCKPSDIDFLLYCSQSPDYFLPSTACILQNRLGLSTSAGALDFNLGCSGYVYGISLAKGLIESGQAKNALLITAETYSKYIKPDDKSVRTIFGDGAAATLVQGIETKDEHIMPIIFGTDGKGENNLIVRGGAMRERGSDVSLYMNGPEIFIFTLKIVPALVEKLLFEAKLQLADINLFVFHQANKYMLEHLRDKLKIPAEKFYIYMENIGNTVSSTIPIALKQAMVEGKAKAGDKIMLVGFGVGYSWAGSIVTI